MNNLTTRRIVFGLLMTLVLAFSVQGIADALSFTSQITRKDSTAPHVYTGDPFEIQFSVSLVNSQAANSNTKQASAADIANADGNIPGEHPGVPAHPITSDYTLITDVNYSAGITTHYYTVTTTARTSKTDNTGTDVAGEVVVTTHTRNWLSEDAAYYYNREAVSITPAGGITILSINGNTINVAEDAVYTLNENERWGGTTTAELTSGQIRVRCSAGSTPGLGSITLADATTGDYPTGVSTATAPTAFPITIVRNPLNLATYPTIESVSEGVLTHNVRNQISVTLTGTNSTFAEVGFEVLSGFPGNLYLSREGGSSTKKLLTYTNDNSVASVYLLPNSRTNQVRVWVSGQNPASTNTGYARVVTYTYGFSDLTADLTIGGPGGNGQRGVFNTRLPNPFVVKVIDGTNRGFPGAVVTFDTNVGTLFPHPDFRAEPVTNGGTQGNAIAGYDPLLIKTDRNGEAKVHLKLHASTAAHTVTASYGGASRTFTATGIDAASTTYVLTIDTQHSAQAQSVALRTRAAEPLVVRVLEGGVNPVADVPVRFTVGTGTLSPRREADHLTDTTPNIVPNLPTDRTIETNARGEAWIDYIAGNTNGPVTIYARAFEHTPGTSFSRIDSANTVTFSVNVGGSTRQPDPTPTPTGPTNTIGITPSTITGEPGEEILLTITSDPSARFVALSSDDFANSLFSPQSGTTPFQSTLTLPDEDGEYDITATSAGLTSGTATVTVETGILGRISISRIGTPSDGAQSFSITVVDTDGDRISGSLTVRLSGTGFTSRNVETLNGVGNARLTLPTAAGLYTLTASAADYTSGTTQIRIAATEQEEEEEEEEEEEVAPPVSEPDSISIVGPSQRDGTANTELDAALIVQVTDDAGDAVADARVIFRVRTGRGQLSERGNGRAIAVQTDSQGYGRATYTPMSASSTVEAEARGVTRRVTFTITASGGTRAPTTRDTDTGTTPDAISPVAISPVVHVGAAQRPPMLWVDGGAIYALVGASPQRFAPGVDNAMNIAIGGGKVYWTEKTGESAGTINSANLNGSGVKELKAIKAVPMGIAVDVTNSKLYWTNSRGRIQSLNADGSDRIENVLQNLEGAMDIALAGGNAYWTEGGNVRFVNLRGQKQIRNVSTGMDTAGSLAIGGGKVYWTEMTGENAGTINSANLNGSGAKELNDIRAVPMGIAVDAARSKLYWTNSRGRVQSANLNGKKIQNVVSGLGSPSDMVLSNSITAPVETPTTTTPTTASRSKYDINRDGTVDSTDAGLIVLAISTGDTNARLDVNGDGKVNFSDYVLVTENFTEEVSAGAPTLLGMKMTAFQIDRLQEQINLLIASGDRSPATMRALIYFQQLIAMARPEKTQLLANYPNPFNPETWIPYELAADTNVKITIYNTQGVVVRTLELGHQSAGYYTGRDRAAYWDGRNAFGEQVASGIYFYQFETDEMSSMRKMVILK